MPSPASKIGCESLNDDRSGTHIDASAVPRSREAPHTAVAGAATSHERPPGSPTTAPRGRPVSRRRLPSGEGPPRVSGGADRSSGRPACHGCSAQRRARQSHTLDGVRWRFAQRHLGTERAGRGSRSWGPRRGDEVSSPVRQADAAWSGRPERPNALPASRCSLGRCGCVQPRSGPVRQSPVRGTAAPRRYRTK